MFSLVFSRRFAMAHRLLADATAKCAMPHGHNEVVMVRLVATQPLPLDGRYHTLPLANLFHEVFLLF